MIISVSSFNVTKELIWISSKQFTKRNGEHIWSCFFHVLSWFSFFILLMTSVSLEFLLIRYSMFSSSSCILFACSTNFYWRAVDSLIRLMMLFWFCLASDPAVSVLLSIACILVLSLSNLVFLKLSFLLFYSCYFPSLW